jgi:acyl-CoA reductase-like NAD-dependent aldehyde dehydrogenase
MKSAMTPFPECMMTIGGFRVGSDTLLEVVDPAEGATFAYAPDCSREQLDEAVAAAIAAYGLWRNAPIAERQDALRAIADRMEAHADEIALLLTREQGKPLTDAKAEIAVAAGRVRGTADVDLPETIAEPSPGRRVKITRVPLGVVGAIAPWNFPISLAMQKVASALVTGNTVILKPSPFTPLSTLRIGELLRDVLPPGVLNVVSGGHQLGPWITDHPGIAKISFTGSAETGRLVMSSAARTLKRVTLELGGNDAAIIFPDVDIAATAEKIFWAAFLNAGQICIAAKRIYVHAEAYHAFREAFVAYARSIPIGPGVTPGSRIGPVQNRLQFDRVRELVEDCRREGYALVSTPADGLFGPGYFLPLTIVDNPPDHARVVQEEQFGPIVPLLRFDDVDDLVARVNATPYGLGASIWTTDLERARQLAERIESGTVWINEVQRLSPAVPFGGHKQSGIGPEGGVEGLFQYTDAKVTTLPSPVP